MFFKKGALEFVVKILDKYTYKEFLKIWEWGRNHAQSDYFHI